MLKSLLKTVGLAAAPAPYRKYAAASSVVGVLPVAAFVAWKYRDQIASFVRDFQHGGGTAEAARA